MSTYLTLISFLNREKNKNSSLMKADLENLIGKSFSLRKQRSVWVGDEYAVRFSEARNDNNTFSNVVLSLSALQKYDELPFIVVVVRPSSLDFRLANTTFLKKISHSSQSLTENNIKGSFLGHDILNFIDGIPNEPDNFEKLYYLHKGVSWEKNIRRLVDATNSIEGTGSRFLPNATELETIYSSPDRTRKLIASEEFKKLKTSLKSEISSLTAAILIAAKDQNINTRGNSIEQLITRGLNRHGTEDIAYSLITGECVKIDIKTKIAGLSSSPKAFNIDKLLKELSDPSVYVFYCFVVIDLLRRRVESCLLSVFDINLLEQTRTQHHWAGRNSRGATQLSGDISFAFDPNYEEKINTNTAKLFLKRLVD